MRPDGSGRSCSVRCGATDGNGSEPTWSAVWPCGPGLVPESLAYAVLAGVPPVVGLWAAPAALVLYMALGSSRHLVVGPMSASAALSGVVVAGLTGDPGRAAALTAGLALVTGVISVGAGLLRLGFLAGFVSQPVLKGFVIGLALTIVAGQLPKIFGVERVEGVFYEKVCGGCRPGWGRPTGGRWPSARDRWRCCWCCDASPPWCPRPWSWCWLGWGPRCCWSCPSAGWRSLVRSPAACRPLGCPNSSCRTSLHRSVALGIALVGLPRALPAKT